jgi:exodeoxyribonuclease V beta subunit
MEAFDMLDPLPTEGSTTLLEASAGTGKTFTLAGLVTRYLAEGHATLDEMLLITFNRAASRELRERVRDQIAEAAGALEDCTAAAGNKLLEYLCQGSAEQRDTRRDRLRDALAAFDTATIATTHQFCSLALKSLGVAGDTVAGVRLEENLKDLIAEIVDDIYLSQFGNQDTEPPFAREEALKLAEAVVDDPCAELRPLDADPESDAAARLMFARAVVDELELRKRRRLILSYNDLLKRLADALKPDDSSARDRMRRQWRIVMVDEFQDTDPIQWQVIDRAFRRYATLILIGDPKQAIYAFRGGDIYTYLKAKDTADIHRTLAVNWRSDEALVDSLQTVLRGAALGHPDIVVRPVGAHHHGHRLAGAPHNAPFRLRVVARESLGYKGTAKIPIDTLRSHIPADLAADIAGLLANGATWSGEPIHRSQIAVIVESHRDARACRDALAQAGIPAVYTGDQDVFESTAAAEWLVLMDAFDQQHRHGVVRAAAASAFFGYTAHDLDAEREALTDQVADTLREWAEYARQRGIAAVFEAAQMAGMRRRVLGHRGGERLLTDLAHIAELLQETAHHDHLNLPGLREWLRRQRKVRSRATERGRRLDSDAAAVQIMTVHAAKGLQFPVVYLPFAFNRFCHSSNILLFHDPGDNDAETRCLHIGGAGSPGLATAKLHNQEESAGNDIRLTYVALTRAQSQVVTWWAPTRDEPNGGLSRLLRDRARGEPTVRDRCNSGVTDDAALAIFQGWQDAGGPVVEESVIGAIPPVPTEPAPKGLAVRHFHRSIDTSWRRTSYSALIRRAEDPGVGSEPEVDARDDEADGIPVPVPAADSADMPSPMAALPTGRAFGSLVHAVLETADPAAPDLANELAEQVRTHAAWWPVDVDPDVLAAALVPMHDTPLGPLAAGLTLRQIGMPDRLRELDFEIPLAGGDRVGAAVHEASLSDVGERLRAHLPSDDPLATYADRLTSTALGDQPLRGYLSGSIDAVLRLPDQRYLVVDYKTNDLGGTAADYGGAQLTEAMLHADYPLQALLYTVVLHRFLRWRQPGYNPAQHLGGVLYLFVRGMCGVDTPLIDDLPAGVFSWHPPVELVAALSDLLDAGRVAA